MRAHWQDEFDRLNDQEQDSLAGYLVNIALRRSIKRSEFGSVHELLKVAHAFGLVDTPASSQAAEMLVRAAESLARQPSAMQLRYLQTLADISHEKTQIIVFPLPLDLIKPLLGSRGE